jgi:hypothetical protein
VDEGRLRLLRLLAEMDRRAALDLATALALEAAGGVWTGTDVESAPALALTWKEASTVEDREDVRVPPMPTGWRLANLLDEQLDGVACCHCRAIVGAMVPVGTVGAHTLFACYPPCPAAKEAGEG